MVARSTVCPETGNVTGSRISSCGADLVKIGEIGGAVKPGERSKRRGGGGGGGGGACVSGSRNSSGISVAPSPGPPPPPPAATRPPSPGPPQDGSQARLGMKRARGGAPVAARAGRGGRGTAHARLALCGSRHLADQRVQRRAEPRELKRVSPRNPGVSGLLFHFTAQPGG